MFELPIEDIHRLLETIDRVRSSPELMGGTGNRAIEVGTLPDLSMVVLEVLGWTNTAYMENKLGIDPSVLSKFVKMRGNVPLHVARAVAERLRTYLRSEDQAFTARKRPATQKETTTPEKKNTERRTVAVAQMKGEQWVAVGESSEIKVRIGVIASLLDSIIDQTKHANVPPDQQIISEIEKQQLIAVLETALNVLRSPLVEKGLFKSAEKALRKGAEAAVENGVQVGLGAAMGAAAVRFGELIHLIFG
jgi:hypothetical protein